MKTMFTVARLRTMLIPLFATCVLSADQPASWKLANNAHFEVYSDAGEDAARSTLAAFEQLRAWFLQQTNLSVGDRPPVRILAFRSAKEYREYSLGPTSDAHYIGTESRDYIAMPVLPGGFFGVAAHEYAHLMLHASGLQLPPWLSEGLAEFFSTVRFEPNDSILGGDLPARHQTLERNAWLPLNTLLTLPADSPLRADRHATEVFYAESWALADMLALSPNYSSRFDALIKSLAGGTSSSAALQAVYGKPLPAFYADLQAWVRSRHPVALSLPPLRTSSIDMNLSAVSDFDAKSVIADILLTIGDFGRARSAYEALNKAQPDNANVMGGLATVALVTGDREAASRLWKAAIAGGITEPFLCYRYAMLAQTAGFPEEDTRASLERAVALRPGFDDARYALALSLNNVGQFERALDQFHAMRYIAPARTYAYWCAVSYAYAEVDRRPEALDAAQNALRAAASPEEQMRARQLTYMAQTDLTVQVLSDKNGQLKLTTARKLHNSANWNAFIEPTDRIMSVDAKLTKIECKEGKIVGLGVSTTAGTLNLAVPDPTHVQMLNAPASFSCGPQPESRVTVVYAASLDRGNDGIVRGVEFR